MNKLFVGKVALVSSRGKFGMFSALCSRLSDKIKLKRSSNTKIKQKLIKFMSPEICFTSTSLDDCHDYCDEDYDSCQPNKTKSSKSWISEWEKFLYELVHSLAINICQTVLMWAKNRKRKKKTCFTSLGNARMLPSYRKICHLFLFQLWNWL